MEIPESLNNHFLIAMPSLKDTFFSKSVIYLTAHNSHGAMGIIINRSLQITLESLLQHLDIEVIDKELIGLPVLAGGPVNPEQGFVIYKAEETEYSGEGDEIRVTASKEILQDIGQGNGPQDFVVALGSSGWEKGQLENEINRNDWLVAPANQEILFSTPLEKRWQKAAQTIGIDIISLSGQVGHA